MTENLPVNRSPPRRFNLADAVILIAALAVCSAMLKASGWFARFPTMVASCCDATLQLCHLRAWQYGATTHARLLRLVVRDAAEVLLGPVFFLLVPLAPALLLIRLRQPRPPLKQIVRQPVFGVFAVLISGILVLSALNGVEVEGTLTGLVITFSAAMLWVVTGLPLWRPEPSWVDRAGRGAGVGWIAAFFLLWLANWLP